MPQTFQKRGGEGSPYFIDTDSIYQYQTLKVRKYYDFGFSFCFVRVFLPIRMLVARIDGFNVRSYCDEEPAFLAMMIDLS